MDYLDYLSGIRKQADGGELSEYGRVLEGGREYPLLRLTTTGRFPLTLTSGFHGEEQAGPLTFLAHLGEIIELARSRDVALSVYPCVNPSGFEAHTRYNRSGEKPNNDFLRYEVAPGVFKGELQAGEPFLRWELYREGPKETRALRDELERHPPPRAALDLHQDDYFKDPTAYAYVFGDHATFKPFMDDCEKQMGIARGYTVDELKNKVGEDGLIELRDGSVTDYFMRRGVPYTACLETTTSAPPAACDEVNLIWIRGFIELATR